MSTVQYNSYDYHCDTGKRCNHKISKRDNSTSQNTEGTISACRFIVLTTISISIRPVAALDDFVEKANWSECKSNSSEYYAVHLVRVWME